MFYIGDGLLQGKVAGPLILFRRYRRRRRGPKNFRLTTKARPNLYLITHKGVQWAMIMVGMIMEGYSRAFAI